MLPCTDGIYCKVGSVREQCPLGHYCNAINSTFPISCPRGTDKYQRGGATAADCNICENVVCDVVGIGSDLNSVNRDCYDGYSCLSGAAKQDSVPCETGFKCQNGKSDQCENGQYQASIGQSECVTCPDGYLCLRSGNQSNPIQDECPPGNYFAALKTPMKFVHWCARGFLLIA